jgi:hypothetical protein
MKTITEKMQAIVERKVESYKTDFTTHDMQFIADNPEAKFIWIVRTMGTHVYRFHTNESLPAWGETVKYIFGYADRTHILRDELKSLRNCFEDSRHEFYIVDLEKQTITQTDHGNAIDKLCTHVHLMLKG